MPRSDPLGRAMLDYHRSGLRGEFLYRNGDTTWEGDMWTSHFKPPDRWEEYKIDALESLAAAGGPVLDAGCGGGMYALWLQERGVDVISVDISPNAVRTARERGLENVQVADIFSLDFDPNTFQSVLCTGTQIGSAGSVPAIRQFLSDLATITKDDAIVVVDSNNPLNMGVSEEIPGYRPDPREGFASRLFHEEYHRETVDGTERIVGPTRHVLIFSPSRLEDIVVGTPWNVEYVYDQNLYYWARLEKSH